MTTQLLQGIRAIDMTEVWAGPMGASFLGDLGADVVKVESYPRPPALSRPLTENNTAPGDGPPYERTGAHHMANRNKRDIAVNVRTEAGVELLDRLIASVDVFIEGYSAGTIENLGFGYERLRQLNPRLIMISMPGWGVEGPYRGYATLGSGLDSTLGHAIIRGYPGGPADEIPVMYHTDATGAVGLVFAVVTALRQREQTGEGCFVDLSQAETFAWQLPGLYAEWTMNRRLPRRLGNADPHVVPHGCYPTPPGLAGDESWVTIAAETDDQWRGVATAAGHPEWAQPPHPWATVVGRLRAREAIDHALTRYAATATAEDIADAVVAAGGLAASVAPHVALLASPQLAAHDWLLTTDHSATGTQTLAGFPWRISPDAPAVDRPCALVGQHNHEVLTDLGYTSDEITELEAAGAIGNAYGPWIQAT
jgi:crotonobetainyl-CoA:carnitine CoA-transferase CaiB-like acyl-CoA transferase